jgi:hypothetical protein
LEQHEDFVIIVPADNSGPMLVQGGEVAKNGPHGGPWRKTHRTEEVGGRTLVGTVYHAYPLSQGDDIRIRSLLGDAAAFGVIPPSPSE